MEKRALAVVPDTLPLPTPLAMRARQLRASANEADRQIAADLERDLRSVAARCREVREFIGIPDRERSEMGQLGVLIERGLAAMARVRGNG